MRLIKVDTRRLEEFFDSSIPKYAILSHTWGVREVTLREFEKYPSKACTDLDGYHKIDEACLLAEAEGLQYVWVDSCCIDKKSSAELSEAINSMFRWYMNSEICFVHMADVHSNEFNRGNSFASHYSSFCQSRWFTRGWTLQELLAPRKLCFFSKHWKNLFTICRNDATWEYSYFSRSGKQRYNSLLQSTLEDITGINLSTWLRAGLAEILSWASKRQTTRKEDMAYCLLGLLKINMPLLYGEGEAAFPRLLSEVARVTNDQSIFAAGYNLPWSLSIGRRAASWSTFASQAKEYQGCSQIFISEEGTFSVRGIGYHDPEILARLNLHPVDADLRHFIGTGAGLQIRLPMVEIDPATGTFLGLLNCYHKGSGYQLSLVLQGDALTYYDRVEHIQLSMDTMSSGVKKGHDIFRVAPGNCPISVPPLFHELATLRTIYIQSNWELEHDELQLSFPDLSSCCGFLSWLRLPTILNPQRFRFRVRDLQKIPYTVFAAFYGLPTP